MSGFDRYENRKRIGQMLASLRNEKGMTVRELAEKAEVSYSNVSKIENGRYNASVDIIGRILFVLSAEIEIKQTG